MCYKRANLLFAVIIILSQSLFSQTNPYDMNDEVYNYYRKCLNYGKEPIILSMSDTMRTLAIEKKDLKGECIALNLKTRYYLTKNDIDSIEYHKEIVHRFAEHTPHTAYIFSAWNCVLQYYLDMGDYKKVQEEALEYQKEAIRLKCDYGIGQSYRVLGEIFFSISDYRQAILQYEKSANYLKQKDDPNLYESYNSLSDCYYKLEEYNKAEKYALLSMKSCNVETLRSTAYINLVMSACGMRDITKATAYMKQLDMLRKKVNHFFPVNENRYAQVQVEFNLLCNKKDIALEWTDSLNESESQLHYKAIVYEAMGDYKKALEIERIDQHRVDSIRLNQSLERMELYSERFDNAKLMADKELQRRNTIIIVCCILFIVSLFFLIFRALYTRKLYREKEKAEKASIEAEKARAEAEKADKLKSIFLQNVSHEIRTPLNAIVGFSNLIKEDEYSKEEKDEFANLIDTNNYLLTTLVNDILDLSKLESGTYKLQMEYVTAREICENAYHSIENRKTENVDFIFNIDSEQIELYTDKYRVIQVITNMLSNAYKNTIEGSVTLDCHRIDDNLVVKVRDTGCGIPAEKAEFIFERFSKTDSFKQGTGLGLNICRQICNLLNAEIKLNVQYKDGAEFIFTLPIK